MPTPPDTIGDWTPTTLIKFIRDLQEQQPKTYYTQLQIDRLEVEDTLTLSGNLVVPTRSAHSKIGAQGQPGFEGTWVNWGAGGFPDAAFWKDPLGFVHLIGAVKSGTSGTTAFTLPPGFRPPAYMVFPSVKQDGGTTSIARVDVNTDGTVVPQTAPATGYIVLNGIYFKLTT